MTCSAGSLRCSHQGRCSRAVETPVSVSSLPQASQSLKSREETGAPATVSTDCPASALPVLSQRRFNPRYRVNPNPEAWTLH